MSRSGGFRDRRDAGRRLAAELRAATLESPRDLLVLALPRGGVPVGAEIAAAFSAPLDVLVTRKIGAPGHPELGIGAVAEGGGRTVTSDALTRQVGPTEMERLVAAQQEELRRQAQLYRGGRPLPDLTRRDVVVVDDGLATGVTAEAALRSLQSRGLNRLILAVPVCAPDTRNRLAAAADRVVCLVRPPHLRAVGDWYDDFGQVTDDEVTGILARFPLPSSGGPA